MELRSIGAPSYSPAVSAPRGAAGDSASIAGSDHVSLSGTVAAAAPAPVKRTWQDEVFYFVMTDRFENGDKGNDVGCDPSEPERFHGGDWQGVINRLDDLKDLGVTALWLSPVVMNDADFLGDDGYHGYWPRDFDQTEPRFGTREKLKELVDEAHKRGIRIVIDLVLNHTGYNHPWASDPKREEWFHHDGAGMEKMSLWGLPDLDQDNPEVAKYLIDNAVQWATDVGADGYRLDAVMHMPRKFVKDFNDALHKARGDDFLLLGEAYTEDQEFLCELQRETGCDSIYDFPLANALRSVAGRDQDLGFIGRWKEFFRLRESFPGEAYRVRRSGGADPRRFQDLFAKDGAYEDPTSLMTIIENHDMPRFMSAAGDRARDKFKQALTLQFAFRGIPCVYYGAEDGMGAAEEDLRADERHGADPDMRSHIKALAHLRHASPALRRGAQREVLCDRQVYAFTREAPSETVLVAANVSREVQKRVLDLPKGTKQLTDLLTGEVLDVRSDRLSVSLDPTGTRLWRVTR